MEADRGGVEGGRPERCIVGCLVCGVRREMRRYEIGYTSVNSENYGKPITALVTEPDEIGAGTGVMLFTHGWGGSRFQHEDKMLLAAEAFDLICVAVEYRQSGFDFDPVTGQGADVPYDAGFYQVFDVLGGLRTVLGLRGGVDRRRLFHYGGSQGGHLALLSAVFAPRTFAFVYASCPITHLDEEIRTWAGREFAPWELSVRDVIEHAGAIRCPVFLEYGTADTIVRSERHSVALADRLEALGKPVTVRRYEGGEHSLEPTTTKLAAFQAMAPEPMRSLTTDGRDDFATRSRVTIPCGDRSLHVDWSRPPEAVDLFEWQA